MRLRDASSDGLIDALLDDWQRGFPLQREPYAAIAAALAAQGVRGADEAAVIEACAQLQRDGVLGRIGGLFAAGSGGAGMLVALRVPPQRL
ncbi:MAG TPA: hypothetical protein PLB41_04955, partial [Rubrivivax sp.]|nr:hypothetical protein [Rubrivivax sp.]